MIHPERDVYSGQDPSMHEPGPEPDPRILVVDDMASIHADFRKILGPARPDADKLRDLERAIFGDSEPPPERVFELDSAYQGQEALDKVNTAKRAGRPYAVVFLDVRMPPGWNGVDTAAHLLRADDEVHVVLCTAYSDYGWGEIMQAVGETDRLLILKKPFHPTEVRQLAHTLTAKWRLERANRRRVEDLERRVAERTRDLREANDQLRREMGERVRAESELRKAQRLEALGRLAAGLGHEINNPLSFIVASLEAMELELEDVREVLPADRYEELVELMGAAAIGADRVTQIIRNIKLFARPSNAPAERCDVTAAVALCAKMVECEIDSRITIDLELGEVPAVIGQRVELEQVLINLLKNAAHALADDLPPAPRICATTRVRDSAVEIEIADNGPGIDESVIDKIFDPFFTTKPVDKGSGLGLAICHSIIQGLGGSIHIRSPGHRGTIVTVRLPPAEVATGEAVSPGASPPSAPIDPAPRGRVLVVDDEPFILRIVERALRPHDVVTTSSGQKALELCATEAFDVILCDIMMPGLNGRDFYHELERAQPGAERRVVFITGGALLDEVKAFLTSVPNECIEKPFEIAALRKTVERHLRAAAPGPVHG